MSHSKQKKIGFLVFDGFPMACLTSLIEPLRVANEICERTIFTWFMLSEAGEKRCSSAGLTFEVDHALCVGTQMDILFVLSSPLARFADEKGAHAILRRAERHGTVLGGISGGIFPLARAGVLRHCPISVHWCYDAAFRAEFPDLDSRRDLIILDKKRYTASGAAAAFDVALHMIEEHAGKDVAFEVACWFQHPTMRSAGVQQQSPDRTEQGGDPLPALVARCIALWTTQMSPPLTLRNLAEKTGITTRQIERAFKKATGQSPSHYYRTMRMHAARKLVIYSRESLTDIAEAVGYSSPTPLNKHYKAAFGLSPGEDRRRANRFRVEDNAPLPSVQSPFSTGGYLSKPQASVGWQENRFREPQNT